MAERDERDQIRAIIYDYCERSSAWDDVAHEAAEALLQSDWLAAHDAALGERIAKAVETHADLESERTNWDGKSGMLGNWIYGIREAARIARSISTHTDNEELNHA